MAALINILIFLLAGVILAGWAAGQNCGCAANLCCSQYGYCGSTDDYCGAGCQQGPCKGSEGNCNGNTSVQNVVTTTFFNGIKSQSAGNCSGQNFYTRSAFLTALRSYPCFGTEMSDTTGKREIAAMFAHYTYETGHLCYIEERNGASRNYCDLSNTQWPCKPGKAYYSRGPLQISWNYNYGPVGQGMGLDLLNSPETVVSDPVMAFETGFWFWMNNVHFIFVHGQGFGATIRAIRRTECNGGNPDAVMARVQYYLKYCAQFGVSPGRNLYC